MSKKKLIAFRASKGPTSDFIDRFLRERPQATWGEMKQELTVRFSEIVDQQHALTLLRKIKQKPREPIQLFAERLFTLSEDAFERDGVGVLGPGAEQQLVAYFIDGLLDYHLKAKILRENPATFRAAVTCAANEQNFQDRIQLRLGKPVKEKERVDIFQGNRGEPVRWRWGTCALSVALIVVDPTGPGTAGNLLRYRQGMSQGRERTGQSNAGNAGVRTSEGTAKTGVQKTDNTSTR